MTSAQRNNMALAQWLAGLAAAALIGLGVWAWYHYMERYDYPRVDTSEAAAENSMLAATRLLRQHGHQVDGVASLGLLSLQTLPDGILIIGDNHGSFAPTQLVQLRAWMQRGNTLIMSPKGAPRPAHKVPDAAATAKDARQARQNADQAAEAAAKPPRETENDADDADDADAAADDDDADDADEAEQAEQADGQDRPAAPAARRRSDATALKAPPEAPLVEADPLPASKGAGVQSSERLERQCNPGDLPFKAARPSRPKELTYARIECYNVPGSDYDLTLDTEMQSLYAGKRAVAAKHTDRDGRAAAVYAEGRGRLVLTAINFFDNEHLKRYDHAELLLALSQLAPARSHVQIVQRLDILPWYRALWAQFSLAIAGLALGLLLWLWGAVTRFGPLLPAPGQRRRALLEHVNASGRWLWQAPGGRDTLLAATRKATTAVMQRRAPELLRLPPEEQAQRLAGLCRLAADDILRALHDEAARPAADFTRQISTLQTLRDYYAQQQR